MLKPEKNCPKCDSKIDWKVVLEGDFGNPIYNGLCKKCCIVFRKREAPEITEGMALERDGKINGVSVKKIAAMDERITGLSCHVQIGILRERQKHLHT